MPRSIDQDLSHLRTVVLEMGGQVEQGLEKACVLIMERNPSIINEVGLHENRINNFQIEIDSRCLSLIARLAPVAIDLRRVMAIVKINTDLERMGDQVKSICYNARDYLGRSPIKQVEPLMMLAKKTQLMVKDALDAFVREDQQLARDVLERDAEIDGLRNQFIDDIKSQIAREPNTLEASIDLMLIARSLERISDHSTNIGEEVIFVCSGEDVRHRSTMET